MPPSPSRAMSRYGPSFVPGASHSSSLWLSRSPFGARASTSSTAFRASPRAVTVISESRSGSSPSAARRRASTSERISGSPPERWSITSLRASGGTSRASATISLMRFQRALSGLGIRPIAPLSVRRLRGDSTCDRAPENRPRDPPFALAGARRGSERSRGVLRRTAAEETQEDDLRMARVSRLELGEILIEREEVLRRSRLARHVDLARSRSATTAASRLASYPAREVSKLLVDGRQKLGGFATISARGLNADAR